MGGSRRAAWLTPGEQHLLEDPAVEVTFQIAGRRRGQHPIVVDDVVEFIAHLRLDLVDLDIGAMQADDRLEAELETLVIHGVADLPGTEGGSPVLGRIVLDRLVDPHRVATGVDGATARDVGVGQGRLCIACQSVYRHYPDAAAGAYRLTGRVRDVALDPGAYRLSEDSCVIDLAVGVVQGKRMIGEARERLGVVGELVGDLGEIANNQITAGNTDSGSNRTEVLELYQHQNTLAAIVANG